MKTPKLRIPKIDEMLALGVAKATPAMVVMGAWEREGHCLSFSSSPNDYEGVCCVSFEGRKSLFSSNRRDVSVRPALPESVASKIRPNNVRAGEFFETSYEGIGGGKPVAGEMAKDILKNIDKIPQTGKAYPVFNAEQKCLESVSEILYNAKKYVVLTGQQYSKIGDISVEKGEKYVFEVEKLRVDDKGHFEYPMIVAPIELKDFLPYHGNMDKTWMGQEVLPKLAESLMPSKVDEKMIRKSYELPKAHILKKIAKHQADIQKLQEELRQYQ